MKTIPRPVGRLCVRLQPHTTSFVIAAFAAVATLAVISSAGPASGPVDRSPAWEKIVPYFSPPPDYAGKLGSYRSPLLFDDGSPVKSAADWPKRRQELLTYWHREMGSWPPVIEHPRIEVLESGDREGFTRRKVRVEIAPEQSADGYILVPPGKGPFPAVFVPFYEPETSTGMKDTPAAQLRAFAKQLTQRGFVTLSIGSPGGDARKPETRQGGRGAAGREDDRPLQPLSYLAYVGANCYNALASLPEVDPKRVGVVGHSYGGKWAMFTSCLWDKYAAAVWSDPGIVWDEARSNVNYWEPWYLGLDRRAGVLPRKPGLITADNPRTGAYKALVESGHDLTELHALMAPRPFLVSGGAEDQPSRWVALNHAVAVNKLLGYENRVGMTNRKTHDPTPESDEVICLFFEHFLMGK